MHVKCKGHSKSRNLFVSFSCLGLISRVDFEKGHVDLSILRVYTHGRGMMEVVVVGGRERGGGGFSL